MDSQASQVHKDSLVHVDKLVQLVNQEHKENVDKQDLQLFKDNPIKLVHRDN